MSSVVGVWAVMIRNILMETMKIYTHLQAMDTGIPYHQKLGSQQLDWH